ncbi:hypothetical protein AGQ61_11385 [Salmonella enterica subsp. enterica]|nr:hypothetical protein AGQ51_11385 [Salmonella enterica subsp. enterica]KYB78925.1 hypothetical protein AGQ61_11385 [Salmonella enterica subsp. enterica]
MGENESVLWSGFIVFFFFLKQKAPYDFPFILVGSELFKRDRWGYCPYSSLIIDKNRVFMALKGPF